MFNPKLKDLSMKNSVMFIAMITLPFLIAGCSSPAQDFADKLCACYQDNNIESPEDKENASDEDKNKAIDCLMDAQKEMEGKIDEMSEEEAKSFSDEMKKALENTDCKDMF